MAENTVAKAISPVELKSRLDVGEKIFLLDVREEQEWAIGHLAGATLIPMWNISGLLHELPDDRPIVAICHHGVRSANVAALLVQNNFDQVYNLTGGIDAWSRLVDPEVPTY